MPKKGYNLKPAAGNQYICMHDHYVSMVFGTNWLYDHRLLFWHFYSPRSLPPFPCCRHTWPPGAGTISYEGLSNATVSTFTCLGLVNSIAVFSLPGHSGTRWDIVIMVIYMYMTDALWFMVEPIVPPLLSWHAWGWLHTQHYKLLLLALFFLMRNKAKNSVKNIYKE